MRGCGGIVLLLALLGACVRYGFGPGEDVGPPVPDQGADRDMAAPFDVALSDQPVTDRAAADSRVMALAHSWSKRFGGAKWDHGAAVAVDTGGNLYLTGGLTGPTNFGGGILGPGGNLEDVFVASFTPAGQHRWSKVFGGSSGNSWNWGHDVTVDGSSGNVYLAGHYFGTMDLGGGSLPGMGLEDIFIASYTSAGQHRWSVAAGDSDEDYGRGVALDASGNVYITGDFLYSVDLGGGKVTVAGSGIFVASYTSAGQHRWSKTFGGSGWDSGRDVAVDSSGNVYITGDFEGTMDPGGGSLTASSKDIFIASFASSGQHRWSKRFGGSGEDQGNSVEVDVSGNVYLTGRFQGSADFGSGPLTSAGGADIFVAVCNPQGQYHWSKRFGGTTNDEGRGVTVDPSGNVYVTGRFQGSVDFGGGPLTSAGDYDIFVLKLMPGP
jgi:hypothetical protein